MSKSLTITFDFRWLIIAALVLAIGVITFLWRPWESQFDKNTRTVEVVGQAVVKATPDETIFTPSYQFEMTNKDAAIAAASEKDKTIVGELKKLGVTASAIKSSTSGYRSGPMMPNQGGDTAVYTLSLTVTLQDAALAQKVQDYLTTTSPEGQVTPQYGFTSATQTKLETQARNEATKDARKKADETAKNLGFTVGGVKSVTDNAFTDYPRPYGFTPMVEGKDSSTVASNFTLQPGENELNYSVKVVYYIQ